MVEIEEQGLIQKFIPHPPVEALDEAVLHRLAGRDVVTVDGVILRPGEDRMRGELSGTLVVACAQFRLRRATT